MNPKERNRMLQVPRHQAAPVVRRPKFVITLTDEEFQKLANRDQHLTETLRLSLGQDVEVIIQREGEEADQRHDEPILFQVHFEDQEPVWGMAQPTTKPEHGRSILIIGVEHFGWWYPDKSLDESVRSLFRTGSVTEIKRASLVI